MSDYAAFLLGKSAVAPPDTLAPKDLNARLFEFQRSVVDWALRRGRAAVFADCGLGKTPMQLEWANQVVRATNKPVLILTPLAVSHQTVKEAEKFGIDASRINGTAINRGVNVTNYERLHHLSADDFSGVVCDESSILKSFDGAMKSQITEFMRRVEYGLLCTATAAPNDYTELGTSSEALGELGYTDMLTRFFKNDQNTIKPMVYRHHGQNFQKLDDAAKWRFKGHAELPFWRWVCSWARAFRRPSDLGFNDAGFVLPELIERDHLVDTSKTAPGYLFSLPAVGLAEQREERRRTITERCEKVAQLVATKEQALVWCHMNEEGDLLEKLIPDAIQVAGKHSDEIKEERLMAFARNEARVLITKPKIGAWGLNLQNCAHVTFFPSHSYEQYYQGVRRCWRFGQTRAVRVDVVTTEGEKSVLANLQRKAAAADRMFSNLIGQMHSAVSIDRGRQFKQTEVMPTWL